MGLARPSPSVQPARPPAPLDPSSRELKILARNLLNEALGPRGACGPQTPGRDSSSPTGTGATATSSIATSCPQPGSASTRAVTTRFSSVREHHNITGLEVRRRVFEKTEVVAGCRGGGRSIPTRSIDWFPVLVDPSRRDAHAACLRSLGVGVGGRLSVALAPRLLWTKSQTDQDQRQGRSLERWASLAGIRTRGPGEGLGRPQQHRETPRSARAVGV